MSQSLSHLLPNRRSFLTGAAAAGLYTFLVPPAQAAAAKPDADINVIGPKPGYSPQIGTLVSMLTWMSPAATRALKGITVAQLDYLFDANANSIGALLLHLAASEVLYQRITFDGADPEKLGADYDKPWGAAMELGDRGRKEIKGHDLDFYLGKLDEVRAKSLAEFKKRDDAWLMTVDKTWGWGPTNNYCKWFHVCEHISHHAGQIDILIKRAPGYKAPNGQG
jgi:uncharacterized damage-inducible protein DinB